MEGVLPCNLLIYLGEGFSMLCSPLVHALGWLIFSDVKVFRISIIS